MSPSSSSSAAASPRTFASARKRNSDFDPLSSAETTALLALQKARSNSRERKPFQAVLTKRRAQYPDENDAFTTACTASRVDAIGLGYETALEILAFRTLEASNTDN